MSRPYKFVYLGNYVINIIIVVSLLSIHWLGLDLPDLKHFLDMGICCMGTWMVLSLFSRSFIVNDAYKGHRILDARTTRQLTILLAIAEAMALYCSGFGHELFIKPATAVAIIWLITFTYLSLSGKLILKYEAAPQ